MILILKFTEENVYTFIKLEIASNNFKCGEFQLTHSNVVMPCISKKDKSLHLCKTNYKNEDLSLCEVYKFDIKISDDFPLDLLNIKIQYYKFQLGNEMFIVNFNITDQYYNESNIDLEKTNIFQKFFLITDDLKISYTVPIENFFIVDMNLIAYNNIDKKRKFIVTVKNKNKMDLITINLYKGVLDIDSMENGYLLGGIDFVKTSKGKIILMDLDKVNSNLYINIYDIEKLSTKTIMLEKLIEIVICAVSYTHLTLPTTPYV